MILNGQHAVYCFCYAPMDFKINSVPDPSHEESRLDVFADKLTRMVIFFSFPAMFWAVNYR